MTITKDVIDDLMPLYLAGEASPGTRRLVEEYLEANPGEHPPAEAFSLPPAAPPANTEMASLRRTREVYNRRTTALACAIAVSCAIFSFRFDSGRGLTFLLYRDLPATAWLLLAAGIGIWSHFLSLHRRWLQTGLPGAVPRKLFLWLIGGALAVQPYAFMIQHRFGINDFGAFTLTGALLGFVFHRATAAR